MSTTSDVAKAAIAIKELEERISTIANELRISNTELLDQANSEFHLNENMEFLKRRKIIASAAEFRKVRYQLQCVREKVQTLRHDTEILRRAYHSTQEQLANAKEHYNKTLCALGDNVVEVKFGKKE